MSREVVGDLRAASGRYPDDARLRRLIDELLEASAEFAALWEEAPVGVRAASRKTIDHPEVGRITLDCDSLHVARQRPAADRLHRAARLRGGGQARAAGDDRHADVHAGATWTTVGAAMAAEPTHVQEIEAILASTAAERRALLEVVSPVLRASLPVDGTGIAQAIEHLGAAVELAEELRAEQREGHRANPAVLHGRVFGRAPLSPDTVLAAFVDGARVRAARDHVAGRGDRRRRARRRGPRRAGRRTRCRRGRRGRGRDRRAAQTPTPRRSAWS